MSGFIPRIIGKAERVSTVLTDVFGETSPFGQEVDVMARDDAHGRMTDVSLDPGVREERVATETGVFLEAITSGDVAHLVSEHPTQVTDLLFERRRGRVRVVIGEEQQGVAAPGAHIFMAPVAIRELLVGMLAEET
jgi:hypothetical protein